MTTFSSNFKKDLESFVSQKRAVGFPYDTAERILGVFDRFALEKYPDECRLGRDMAMQWAEIRSNEHVNTLIHRITPLRQFAKYLLSIGIEAYVIPDGVPAKGIRYVPHIYTKDELRLFFSVLDQFNYDSNSPARHLVAPVLFRLLYCCGLRSSEVTGLKVENVDLATGTLAILESKGHKDRIVMMSEDVLLLCRIYHQRVNAIWPARTYFFPNHRGDRYSKGFLWYTFQKCWREADIGPVSGNSPRVHDFRHTFAVNRLNQWVKENKDLNAYLPYLSMYLGHEHLSETDYYLHLVPEFFPTFISASEQRFAHLIPEVDQ
jgi:integrase